MKRRFWTLLTSITCAASAAFGAAFALLPAPSSARAEDVAVTVDFSEGVTSFGEIAGHYGWKSIGGKLKPDYATEPSATATRMAYYKEKIALNEAKYISFDFYAPTATLDVALVEAAASFNAYSLNAVGLHTNANGYLTLNKNIDLAANWTADYTGAGGCVGDGGHTVEIISDGTNLTFKVDGAEAAFLNGGAAVTVPIPANEVYLTLQTADKNSAIDNLYIGKTAPTAPAVTKISFDSAIDGTAFTAHTDNYGWKAANGKYSPDLSKATTAQISYYKNAIKLNESKYISFDFSAENAPFDMMLAAVGTPFNPWTDSAVGLHCYQTPNAAVTLSTNLDAKDGSWIADYAEKGSFTGDGTHTVEILSDGSNLTFKLDGVQVFADNTVAIPANEAYLTFRSADAETYIDNLYIAASAPESENVRFDFDGAAEYTTYFEPLKGADCPLWQTTDGKFSPVAGWNTVATINTLDLMTLKEISLYFCLSETDTDRQFNVGLFAENEFQKVTAADAGLNVSFCGVAGGQVWISQNFGIQDWAASIAGNYYDGVEHSLRLTFAAGKMDTYIDGVKVDALSAQTLPAAETYFLMQITSKESYVDNLSFIYGEEEVLPPPPVGPESGLFESKLEVDFEEATDGEIFKSFGGSNGWTVKDGKYYPAAAWASVNSYEKLLLNVEKEISFNFYLPVPTAGLSQANQLNVGFFADLTNVGAGSGLNVSINGQGGGEVWISSDFGKSAWIASIAANYFDGNTHKLSLKIADGKMDTYIDGAKIDALSAQTLPASEAYLLIQTTETDGYIDNLYVGEITEETPPDNPDNPENPDKEQYEELSLSFSSTADDGYFTALGNGGWSSNYCDGEFYPLAMSWAASYLTQPIPMDGTKYISLDVFATTDNGDETASQFNVAFLTDLNSYKATAGVHFFMNGSNPVAEVNDSFGKGNPVGSISFNWADGKYHNIKISIVEGIISFAVDGETLKNEDGDFVVAMDETQKAAQTYFTIQATQLMTCIDNLIISNTDIPYVAPETAEETFTPITHDYSNVSVNDEYEKTVASGNTWTANAEGRFSAVSGWSVAYLKDKMSLTDEKTVSFTFCLSAEADPSHQFLVGIGKTENSYQGLFLTFYQGALNLNYWLGPTSRKISSSPVNYFDGQQHAAKIIIEEMKATVLIDNKVVFKDVQVGMTAGYFKLQSSNTTDWIDDLSIKNVADPVSIPTTEGDITLLPDGTGENGEALNPKGDTTTSTVWVALTVTFGVLTALSVGGAVFVFLKKKKD